MLHVQFNSMRPDTNNERGVKSTPISGDRSTVIHNSHNVRSFIYWSRYLEPCRKFLNNSCYTHFTVIINLNMISRVFALFFCFYPEYVTLNNVTMQKVSFIKSDWLSVAHSALMQHSENLHQLTTYIYTQRTNIMSNPRKRVFTFFHRGTVLYIRIASTVNYFLYF